MTNDSSKWYLILLGGLMLAAISCAAAIASAGPSEATYAEAWCAAHDGQPEVTLPDRTRADCLTATHAVEVERAAKWKESIGQALWYALQTNLRAGVVVILEDADELSYWYRLNSVIEHYNLPIDTWPTGPAAPAANDSTTGAVSAPDAQPAVACNTGSRSGEHLRVFSLPVIRSACTRPPASPQYALAAGGRHS